MRNRRRKIKGRNCFYHLFNKISGYKGDYPFSDKDKLHAIDLLKQLSLYYLIEIMEFCIMGNHFHIIVHVPGKPLAPIDALKRHNKYFCSTDKLIDNSAKNRRLGKKIALNQIDISHFMQIFQQKFTIYYNKEHNRSGSLWGDRFKSTILEGSIALWCCVEYVIMNPVRAGLCLFPESYFFSAWGERKYKGKHPFHKNLLKHLAGVLKFSNDPQMKEVTDKVLELLEQSINDTIVWEQQENFDKPYVGMKQKYHRVMERVRKWTYGCIVGSYDFVKTIAEEFDETNRLKKRKINSASEKTNNFIFSYSPELASYCKPT